MANSWPLRFPQVNVGMFMGGTQGVEEMMDKEFVGQRYDLPVGIMMVRVVQGRCQTVTG